MRVNLDQGVVYKQPKDLDARAEVARACLQGLKLTIPFLLDDMAGSTEQAYSGWPNRIFVVDLDGKVAMKGPHGPAGVDLPGAEKALKEVLARAARKPDQPEAPAKPAAQDPPADPKGPASPGR